VVISKDYLVYKCVFFSTLFFYKLYKQEAYMLKFNIYLQKYFNMKKLYFLIPFLFIYNINAQNSADRDPTFNTFTLPIGSCFINQTVKKTAVQPDGKILLLERNDNTGLYELMRINNNLRDYTFNTGTAFNNYVHDFILQPDGKIIVVGNFTTYNQTNVGKIVRLNSDGSLDKSFIVSTQVAVNGYGDFESKILLQSDGKLLLTGNINSKLAVIRLNSNGSLDSSFSMGTPFERSISNIAIQPNGKIIVYGIASGTSGYAEGKIVRLNDNGSLETNITPLIKKTYDIYKITPLKDGKILIAAEYKDANSYISGELFRLNSDCTLDTSFAVNKIDVSSSDGITDILVDFNDKIILSGYFYRFNNVTYGGFLRLNPDGTPDPTFKNTGGTIVKTVSLFSDGRILVGGDFKSFNKVNLHNITVLRNDGTLDPGFNNIRVGFDTSSAQVLAVLPDDKLIVVRSLAGGFNAYNGVQNKGFVRLNSDGSQDNTLTFGGGTPFSYYWPSCVAVQKDGKMLVGGEFTGLFNPTTNRIARLNYDGTRDNSFVMGTGFNNTVKKIIVLEDGKILVGGDFDTYKEIASGNIVRLNADGSLDSSFNAKWLKSTTGGQLFVFDFINLTDGKILISTYGFETNRGILRLNSDGSRDTSFILDPQISRFGEGILLQKDGKIITTGFKGSSFQVLRLFSDGNLDNSFNYTLPTTNINIGLSGMQLDDKVFVSGYQTNNNKNRFFARLNLDGSLDDSFHNSFNNNQVDTFGKIVTQSNGKLIYFGGFENYNGVPAGGFIRLLGQDFKFVQGQNRLDLDNNGCDLNDAPFKNLKLNIQSGTSTSSLITNTTGNYTLTFLKGTHTITPVLENPSYFNISPASYTVDFPADASPHKSDFCITANGVHPDLEISILPLTVARPGFDAKYKIVYSNKGNQQLSGTVTLNFDDTVTNVVESYPTISGESLNSLKWDFTNLNPSETKEISIVLNVNTPTENPPVNGGTILKFQAAIASSQTDETPDNNKFVFDQVVVNSFDPNDKTCIEGDKISKTKVGDYVHYIIRFENTGTYAAQNITVKDVIDLAKYDINTLYPLSGSHLFSTEITDNNKVDFKFENINLPFDDANNDGYLAFKIKTKSSLVEGDSFGGSANIFFDYNSAITTNIPTTKIEQALGIKDFSFGKYFVVYPNPVNEVLNITAKEDIQLSSIQIYNVLGQLIRVISNAKNTENIDVSNLNSGNYFIKIFSDKGNSSTKFIKK